MEYKSLEELEKNYTGDKRSKEYKQLKKELTIESTVGLGDVVENITEKTGIKKLVNKITDDCGCDKRKTEWNRKLRFSSRRTIVRCFTDDHLKQWETFLKKNEKVLKSEGYITNVTETEKQLLIDIGKHIFAVDYSSQLKGCSKCIKYLVVDINRVYEKTIIK